MNRYWLLLPCLGVLAGVSLPGAQPKTPRVLAFYSTDVERDHVDFALEALGFYSGAALHGHYGFAATTRWDDLNPERLKDVDLIPLSLERQTSCLKGRRSAASKTTDSE
jgi:uncharacterized protein